MDARELVLDMLLEVVEGKKLYHTVLSRSLLGCPDMGKKDRAFAGRLCTGCVKRLLTLDFLIMQYSSVAIAKMKPIIRNILRMGFYQLWYMEVPPSAVCNESVKLAKKRGFSGLSGFVNGVLRNAARNPADLLALTASMGTVQKLSLRYSVPEWLAGRFISWYGAESTERMFGDFLKRPGLTVRVNQSKTSVEGCREALHREGIEVRDGEYFGNALHLDGVDSVGRLAAFGEGLVQVQDESSMIPVSCAGLEAGYYVIDCCAAPGGKALQAADMLLAAGSQPGVTKIGRPMCGMVSARDISEYKLQKIRENIGRAGFPNIEVLLADARVPRPGDIGKADVVLADLPCSGLGIIGKKPDIKYNVTPEGLEELVNLQRDILTAVVQYLKPGGVLIYSTCTLNKEENEGNAAWIAEKLGLVPEDLAGYLPEALRPKTAGRGWLGLEPEAGKADGFFVSRFRMPA